MPRKSNAAAVTAHVPVFGPKGTLNVKKGYAKDIQVYMDPDEKFMEVPTVVDDATLYEAKWWLYEAIRDFPFSDAMDGDETLPIKSDVLDEDGFPQPNWVRGRSSRTNFLAMLLQPFVRSIIGDSPSPAYHIGKASPGTGAGYLMDVVSMIVEGRRATVQTMSAQNEEFRKNINATLRNGGNIIFIDNINRKVDSGDLAAARTGGTACSASQTQSR
jgi:hypothetical protein